MKSRNAIVILLILSTCFSGYGQVLEKGALTISAGWFASENRDLMNVSIISKHGTKKYLNIALDLNIPFTFGGSSLMSKSLSVGYGSQYIDRFVRYSASAGPAIIWGYDWSESDYHDYSYTKLGLIGHAQFYFTPIKEFGVGLEIVGSYDMITSGYGIKPSIFFQRTL